MVRRLVWLALLCGCNARLGQLANDQTGADAPPVAGDGRAVDAAIDAPADAPTGPWGTPAAIDTNNPTLNVDDPTMTQDGLDLIYAVTDAAGTTKTLYEMQRASRTAAWGTPVPRAELNLGSINESPRFGPGDNTIYYGVGGMIYSATRTAAGDAFNAPAAVAAVNTGMYQKWLAVCGAAGNGVVSRSNPDTTNMDLFEGTVATGVQTIATELNSTASETSSFLATNCLTVYFASSRGGTTQLYTATRANAASAWTGLVAVDSPFSAAEGTDNEDAWVSADGHIFLFAGLRGGATVKQLFISTR
jgi:hypothetical protein